MYTSAQIINLRDHVRPVPEEIVVLENASERVSIEPVEEMRAANVELAHLIRELKKYIPNYVRI